MRLKKGSEVQRLNLTPRVSLVFGLRLIDGWSLTVTEDFYVEFCQTLLLSGWAMESATLTEQHLEYFIEHG